MAATWARLQKRSGGRELVGRERERARETAAGGVFLSSLESGGSIWARTAASGGHGAARQQLADQRRKTTGEMGWTAAGPHRKRKRERRNWAAGPIRF
jgi:hypothetical protein